MLHVFTPDQARFITENVKGISNKELTDRFNAHFNINLEINQIKAYKKNHKLSSELNGQFKKNHIPANKGKKGMCGWKPTEFKKGHIPQNYMPVGNERVNGDGYIDIKIADPNKWKGKHILIWEKHNGPIPKDHVVIFGDGNKRNFNLDNLILVSRQQLLILNRNKLIQKDTDLTKTAVLIANVYQKIYEIRAKAK